MNMLRSVGLFFDDLVLSPLLSFRHSEDVQVNAQSHFVELTRNSSQAALSQTSPEENPLNLGLVSSSNDDNLTSFAEESHSAGASFLLMLIQILFVAPFFLLILWYSLKSWWKSRNIRSAFDPDSHLSHLPLPPGDFGLPIIGETLQWIAQGSNFNAERRKKYGSVFKTNNAISGSMIRVSGRENVKQILKGEHDTVTTIWPTTLRRLLGENGLANSVGALHQMKRKIAFKAFSSSALNSYIPVLRRNVIQNVKGLSACERPQVYQKMLRLTFDLSASALLGLDSKTTCGHKLIEAFLSLMNNFLSLPLNIPGFGFSKALKARGAILDLLQGHVTSMKRRIKRSLMGESEGDSDEEAKETKSAIEIIIRELILNNSSSSSQDGEVNNNETHKSESHQEEKAMDDLTLKEIAMELVFAGYMTTGSALTSTILELSRHPEVRRKLEEELIENGLLKEGSPDDVDQDVEIDLSLLHKLTYMSNVIKETLRLRPPVLGGFRRAIKTFQLGEYRIPKGWPIVYNIRDTHEMEYEGLNEFKPERFAVGTSSDNKFRFIPYGGGPRTCIGQEYSRVVTKLLLVELIRHYRSWDLVNDGLPKMRAIPVLHPADGLPCVFHPREKVGVVSC